MMDTVDSATARPGDFFRFETVNAVTSGATVAIPQRTMGYGVVAVASPAGPHDARPGTLVLEPRYLVLPDGRRLGVVINHNTDGLSRAGANAAIPGYSERFRFRALARQSASSTISEKARTSSCRAGRVHDLSQRRSRGRTLPRSPIVLMRTFAAMRRRAVAVRHAGRLRRTHAPVPFSERRPHHERRTHCRRKHRRQVAVGTVRRHNRCARALPHLGHRAGQLRRSRCRCGIRTGSRHDQRTARRTRAHRRSFCSHTPRDRARRSGRRSVCRRWHDRYVYGHRRRRARVDALGIVIGFGRLHASDGARRDCGRSRRHSRPFRQCDRARRKSAGHRFRFRRYSDPARPHRRTRREHRRRATRHDRRNGDHVDARRLQRRQPKRARRHRE